MATAELAAVALLARAFEVLALADGLSPAARARVVGELAGAVGASGCCAGQAADLSAEPRRVELDDLEAIHAQKTGALFVAAVRGGALAGSAGRADALRAHPATRATSASRSRSPTTCWTWEGDAEVMGKDARRDAHRANFATILGGIRPTASSGARSTRR